LRLGSKHQPCFDHPPPAALADLEAANPDGTGHHAAKREMPRSHPAAGTPTHRVGRVKVGGHKVAARQLPQAGGGDADLGVGKAGVPADHHGADAGIELWMGTARRPGEAM